MKCLYYIRRPSKHVSNPVSHFWHECRPFSRSLFRQQGKWTVLFNILVLFVTTPTQTQRNSNVGFDTKMTFHHNHHHCPHHPPQTQCLEYISCSWPNFSQTLNCRFVGSITTTISTTAWTITTTTTATTARFYLLLTWFRPNYNGRFLG